MSDETVPQPPADEPPAPSPTEGLGAVVSGLGEKERLVAVGAALIVVVWLIFELILAEYFFSGVTLLLAVVTLFAVWAHKQDPEASWPVPYSWALRVLGYSVGFMGLVELLFDLRNGILDNFVDILGGLTLYAGAFLMFYGARALKSAD
jgi:hypothetical protein